MKSWNEIRKAATAFSKRWKNALNRPIARNSDTFGYNERGEVVFSRRGAENAEDAYSYDDIGNLTLATCCNATNTYSANSLNQYTSLCASASLRLNNCTCDLDGNMTQFADWSYSYNAANRFKTLSTNGVLVLTNFYDAKSRRVRKVTAEASTTFFYDDWNLIEERVAHTNGTTSAIRYFWGKDLSGTLQGAGGVGGLLYLTVSNSNSQLELYIPCYDNNGNVTRYLDANGNTVAQYTYDAFGNIISKSGPLADFFRHRFSTKYFDVETGLYYYGYRFYHPVLMRWLNRDPIGEEGGLNLYAFCENLAIRRWDYLGQHWEFSTPKWDKQRKELEFTVKYIMPPSERKCCYSITVDRYVKKIIGIGNRLGAYKLDHAMDGGFTEFRKPYIAYAEGDSPDGQTLFFYRLPWTQSFKWEARCTSGPDKGKILSSIERKFRTTGHFLWNSEREGEFL